MIQGGVSTISGNYPLLFGIREDAYVEMDIAAVLRRHESRSGTPVSMGDFTHIEVPHDKVNEVRTLLEQSTNPSLPVFPIEWGEELSKRMPMSWITQGICVE